MALVFLLLSNFLRLRSSASLLNFSRISQSFSCLESADVTYLISRLRQVPNLQEGSSEATSPLVFMIFLWTKVGPSINIVQNLLHFITCLQYHFIVSKPLKASLPFHLIPFLSLLCYKIKIMINQTSEAKDLSNSRKKIQIILKEQEQVSKAFGINNFYQNQRLNIRELKLKLESFKRKRMPHSPLKKIAEIEKGKLPATQQDHSTAKFASQILPLTHQDNDTLSNIKKRLNFDKSNPHTQQPSHRMQQQSVNNSGFWKPYTRNQTDQKATKLPRYESKTKTVYRARAQLNSKEESVSSKQWPRKRCNTGQKPQQSKCSDTSFQKCFEQCNFEGKIKLSSQGQICQLQNKIALLWSHYQLVTKLLMSLREGLQRQKQTIVRYIAVACSQQFQFLKQLIEQILGGCNSCKEIGLAKRLKKAVILSRLYENIGVVYLCVFISLDLKTQANLTNFIGYCTSNTTFTIKLLVLLHKLEGAFSENTQLIIQTIAEYEKGSYSKKINRISQVVLRMQQNNEVIGIVNGKLAHHLDPSFQGTVSDFLKNAELDLKPFIECAHYIFQFLAFHLAQIGVSRQFAAVQIAPAPYYPLLPKPKTLVIQPWEVLFSPRGNTTFVRSHTQAFLTSVGHYWNIIYWTDHMPKSIEDLLKKLPYGLCLYRYHCKLQRDNYVKILERIGCDIHNTVIIDRCEDNYKYHKQHGICLPWKGHRRDLRLLELLQLFQPIFQDEAPLRSLLGNIRKKLSGSTNIKKKGGKSHLHTNNEDYFVEQLPHRVITNYL